MSGSRVWRYWRAGRGIETSEDSGGAGEGTGRHMGRGICGGHGVSELPSLCAWVPHPAPAPRLAHLHRPALPRYLPHSEQGEEKQSGGAVRAGTGGGMAAPQGSPFTPTVPGTWCPWLECTACSQPCWAQTRTHSRACSCPAPQHGGPRAPGRQGKQGPSIRGRPVSDPPSAQVRRPTGGLQSQGAGTSWASQGKGVLLYSCHSGQSLEPEGTMVSL